MKKLLGLLLIGVVLITSSCRKDDCEVNQFGYMQFKNTTSHIIHVYIDAQFAYTLSPKEKSPLFDTPAGSHSVYAETADLSYSWNDNRTIATCLSEKVTFVI